MVYVASFVYHKNHSRVGGNDIDNYIADLKFGFYYRIVNSIFEFVSSNFLEYILSFTCLHGSEDGRFCFLSGVIEEYVSLDVIKNKKNMASEYGWS